MHTTQRILFGAALLAAALTASAPVHAASLDGIIEWQGVSHLPIHDRTPLVPLDGESFAVRIRVWRNDVEQVRVFHDGSTVDGSVVTQHGPYDIWEAQIPASGPPARVEYSFELRDGADVDHYTLDGMSDVLPTGNDFAVDFSTLEHAPRGATPHPDGGVVFRVWAPNAQAAFVRGQFNGWGLTDQLTSIGGGDFVGHVPNAVINQRYKFYFDRPVNDVWAVDLYARSIDEGDGNNNIIQDPTIFPWTNDGWQTPSLEELVIYQLHMGTYSGGNDPLGTPAFPSGFLDARARLSHLDDLGVNAILLTPVMEFPGERSAGYNPMSQFAPERSYGAPNDLKRFVDAAHARGIAVLLDIVWNHQSISNNVYWNYDGAQSYFDDPPVDTPWGAQLDFNRIEVQDHLIQSMHSWLDEYRLDGFRMDATDFMNMAGEHEAPGWAIMQRMNDEVDNRYADRVIIAEQLPDDDWVTRPTNIGGAGFDAQYFDAFTDRLNEELLDAAFGDPEMWKIRDVINGYGQYLSSNKVVNYLELHDEAWPSSGGQRFVKTVDPTFPHDSIYARGRFLLGQGLVLSAPGVPAMLQGAEWLESRDFGTDEGNRIDWSKKTTYAGVYAFFRDLVNLRTGRLELRANAEWEVIQTNDAANVIVFRRGFGEGTLLVIANFSNDDRLGYRIGTPVDQDWRVLIDSQDLAYGGSGALNPGSIGSQLVAYDGQAQSIQVDIPAMGFMILEKAADPTSVGPITGPSSDAGTRLQLMPAAPNPASGHTLVRFRLPAREAIRMTLHDVRGRRVRTLVDEVKEPGTHEITLDTSGIASGTYFVRMRTLNTWRAIKLTVTD